MSDICASDAEQTLSFGAGSAAGDSAAGADVSADSTAQQQLLRLRSRIDNIDAALVYMLAERFRCTQEVGVLKAKHAMPASDPRRETQQISRLKQLAADAHLDPDFAEKWFNFVVSEVIQHHKQIASDT